MRILLILLIPCLLFGQRIRGRDFTQSAKDTVLSLAQGQISDSLKFTQAGSSISVKSHVEDAHTIHTVTHGVPADSATDIYTALTALVANVSSGDKLVFTKGDYYFPDSSTFTLDFSGVDDVEIEFQEGATIIGEADDGNIFNFSFLDNVTHTLTYTDFVDVAGNEIVEGLNYVAVDDTADWDVSPGDIIRIESSDTLYNHSTWYKGAYFEVSGFGTEDGNQVIYSMKPFRYSFPLATGADLRSISIFKTARDIKISGGEFHNCGFRVAGVNGLEISNMKFYEDDDNTYQANYALLVEHCTNVDVTNVFCDNYDKSGAGYGIANLGFDIRISNSTFKDCRHGVTTTTSYGGDYMDGLTVVNCFAKYSDDKIRTHFPFDSHQMSYDIKFINCSSYGAIYTVNLRSSLNYVEGCKSYNGLGLANIQAPDEKKGMAIFRDCETYNCRDHLYEIMASDVGYDKIVIENHKDYNDAGYVIGTNPRRLIYQYATLIDTFIVDGFEYSGPGNVNQGCTFYYSNGALGVTNLVFDDLDLRDFNTLLDITDGGAYGVIKIKDSEFTYFDYLFNLQEDDSDMDVKLIDRLDVDNCDIYSCVGFTSNVSGKNIQIEDFRFSDNEVEFWHDGFRFHTDSTKSARMDIVRNNFRNSFYATNQLFYTPFIDSLSEISELHISNNEFFSIDSSACVTDNTTRGTLDLVQGGTVKPDLVMGTFYEHINQSMKFYFEHNIWRMDGDIAGTTKFFEMLGGDLFFNNNEFVPDDSSFAYNSATYGVLHQGANGEFRNNYFRAKSTSSAKYWFALGGASSFIVDNNFMYDTDYASPKANSRPLYFNSTGTVINGLNRHAGFSGGTSWGTSTIEHIIVDGLYMIDVTNSDVDTVRVDADTMRVN